MKNGNDARKALERLRAEIENDFVDSKMKIMELIHELKNES